MEQTLLDYFLALVQIDSESLNEGDVANRLVGDLEALGAEVRVDNANEKFSGQVGNVIARFPGTVDRDPIFFSAHLDTVKPGKGVKPRVVDGFVVTDGTTILGADDKSGIAQIVWAIKELQDAGEDYAPVECLFTVGEEIGLLGAVHADYSQFKAKIGYALDSHIVGHFMTEAPTQYNVNYTVRGRAAHAGVEPEKGVNAIQVAGAGLAAMKIGRIDANTTCNIGSIVGGVATNIVPDEVKLVGEIRGHNDDRIQETLLQMNGALEQAVNANPGAALEWEATRKFDNFAISDDEDVVTLALAAAAAVGAPTVTFRGGGGSDANVFNQKGIRTIVAGTGMDKVHTVHECIAVEQLELGRDWVKQVIRMHTNG